MANSTTTVQGEELPMHILEAIHKLVHAGASHQAISAVLGLKLEVVQLVLANDPSHYSEQNRLEAHPPMLNKRVLHNPKKQAKLSENCRQDSEYCTKDLKAPQSHEPPTFIYSYKHFTNQLHRTNLVTGVLSTHKVPSYSFKFGCCWSEVPGESLLITGGAPPARKVVRIDTRREFAVSQCPPTLTSRRNHAAVYHTQHLYLLGGYTNYSCLSECERYVCAEQRWEALPPLPRACHSTSGVVVENSLYALGGYDGSTCDLVQKLSLESLTWELMQLRLPHTNCPIPCFKLRDSEVYLVINKTLCSFTGLQVVPLKTLTESILSSGASYYCRGTLYCSYDKGEVRSHEIGRLSN
jgi:hypothetical protein